jgi:hypothetical protein
VLTANQQPDHSRISEFGQRNLDALKGLFVQILRLCQKAGKVSLGHVAFDGTKMQANSSKHKGMSHERMLRAEKELEKEINALMRRAEILDAQEDKRYGKGKLGSDLPENLGGGRAVWRASVRRARTWKRRSLPRRRGSGRRRPRKPGPKRRLRANRMLQRLSRPS